MEQLSLISAIKMCFAVACQSCISDLQWYQPWKLTVYSFDHSIWLSRCKILYYTIFSWLYGLVGSCAHLVMVNSSWTKSHIVNIWKIPECTKRVYPPCDTSALQACLEFSHLCCYIFRINPNQLINYFLVYSIISMPTYYVTKWRQFCSLETFGE